MVVSLRLAKVGGSFNPRILFRLETSDSSSSSQEQPDRYVHFHELSRLRSSFRKVLSMHIRQSVRNCGIFLPYIVVSTVQSINNGFIPLVIPTRPRLQSHCFISHCTLSISLQWL